MRSHPETTPVPPPPATPSPAAPQVAPVQSYLTDEATDFLIRLSVESDESAFSIASRRFESLPPTLLRVAEATGQKQLPISLALAQDPETEIANWERMVHGSSGGSGSGGGGGGGGGDGDGDIDGGGDSDGASSNGARGSSSEL